MFVFVRQQWRSWEQEERKDHQCGGWELGWLAGPLGSPGLPHSWHSPLALDGAELVTLGEAE